MTPINWNCWLYLFAAETIWNAQMLKTRRTKLKPIPEYFWLILLWHSTNTLHAHCQAVENVLVNEMEFEYIQNDGITQIHTNTQAEAHPCASFSYPTEEKKKTENIFLLIFAAYFPVAIAL